MNRRQRLRRRVVQWLWLIPDRMPDERFDKTPDWAWDLLDKVTGWVARATCRLAGHEAVCDQCHRPEHDYCTWCQRSMPGMAH